MTFKENVLQKTVARRDREQAVGETFEHLPAVKFFLRRILRGTQQRPGKNGFTEVPGEFRHCKHRHSRGSRGLVKHLHMPGRAKEM